MHKAFSLAAAASISATAAAASDADAQKGHIAAALSDLGVSRLVAMECMAKMPDHVWLGSTLTKEQGAADRTAMYSCVKEHNPGLSEDRFNDAVALFR